MIFVVAYCWKWETFEREKGIYFVFRFPLDILVHYNSECLCLLCVLVRSWLTPVMASYHTYTIKTHRVKCENCCALRVIVLADCVRVHRTQQNLLRRDWADVRHVRQEAPRSCRSESQHRIVDVVIKLALAHMTQTATVLLISLWSTCFPKVEVLNKSRAYCEITMY